MTMSDSNAIDSDQSSNMGHNHENNDYRQLAAMIVENMLSKAISKADEHQFRTKEHQMSGRTQFVNSLDLDLLTPAIQIDLVGTRTPSPEDEYIDWSVTKKNYRFRAPADQHSISADTDVSVNELDLTEMSERDDPSIFSQQNDRLPDNDMDIEECRRLAKDLVDNIIIAAIEWMDTHPELVKSKIRTSRSDNQCFETSTWMTRLRQIFARLMRSSCFCKSKQQFRQRK